MSGKDVTGANFPRTRSTLLLCLLFMQMKNQKARLHTGSGRPLRPLWIRVEATSRSKKQELKAVFKLQALNSDLPRSSISFIHTACRGRCSGGMGHTYIG